MYLFKMADQECVAILLWLISSIPIILEISQVKCHTLLVCHLEKIHNSAACYYVKRSRRIYEKANGYNEDSFRLNVSKNGSKRLKKKPARPRSSIG